MRLLLLSALSLCLPAAPLRAEPSPESIQGLLRQAESAYCNGDEPLMSDAAYDALQRQYSRTGPVGAPPEGAAGRPHRQPVLSLNKAVSDAELAGFIEAAGPENLYSIEPKIDGLTVVLHFRNGRLEEALTRGDGKTGADVTAALLTSGTVPPVLSGAPDTLSVRAEACLTFEAFNALNRRRSAAGEPPLKSPRQAAAGTLRLKDPAEIAARGLSLLCFDLLEAAPMPSSRREAFRLLETAGLNAVESRTVPGAGVADAVAVMNRTRPAMPWPTDGIVIKLDDLTEFNRLGQTARYPRGAIARKYEPVPVRCRILDIEWRQSPAGRQTPVARLEPVEINGITVRHASLYSRNYLQALNLQAGDEVLVALAGDAVPEILGPASKSRGELESGGPAAVR